MSFLLGLLLALVPCYSAAETPQEVVLAQIGNSVTIPKVIWGISPNSLYVNWFFNDVLLINKNPTSSSPKAAALDNWRGRISLSSDFSLIISNVIESDFGIFKCEQYEVGDKHEATYKLYWVKMSTSPPLLPHKSLSLSCEIQREVFARVQSVTCRGPDNKDRPVTRNNNKYSLSVSQVSGIHNGKWTCEVKYGGRVTLHAKTDVVIVDLCPSPLTPIYTSESSSNVLLPCSLPSKIPWSTVEATGVKGGSWSFTPLFQSKSTTLLKLNSNLTSVWKAPSGTNSLSLENTLKYPKLDLTLSKVSIKNRGTYSCSLEFSSDTLSRTVQVEVLQVISSADKVIYEGDKVDLNCTLGNSMPPDLEVNWRPPFGSSLPQLNSLHPTLLSIPHVSLKDKGRWTCELKKNATLLISATVSLKIEKAPVDIWLVVAVISGVLALILLPVIIVIIIRKRNQVMKYRRKKRFCCCKNPRPKGFYKT